MARQVPRNSHLCLYTLVPLFSRLPLLLPRSHGYATRLWRRIPRSEAPRVKSAWRWRREGESEKVRVLAIAKIANTSAAQRRDDGADGVAVTDNENPGARVASHGHGNALRVRSCGRSRRNYYWCEAAHCCERPRGELGAPEVSGDDYVNTGLAELDGQRVRSRVAGCAEIDIGVSPDGRRLFRVSDDIDCGFAPVTGERFRGARGRTAAEQGESDGAHEGASGNRDEIGDYH